jgi:large subunit ribosomal protein L18
MQTAIDRRAIRRRIRYRIRKKLTGTPECPRLAVFRSNKHIYVQAIDDLGGRTLASASTLDGDIKSKLDAGAGNSDAAKAVGTVIGERLKSAGVTTVVFDRGGFLFHGRIKALADAAREAGLKF